MTKNKHFEKPRKQPKRCKCGARAVDLHRCPYQVEICEDKKLCNCCPDCTRKCGEEV